VSNKGLLDIKMEQYRLLQEKKKMQEKLPHLYSWKWYSWARKFFESKNRINLLCAANQISKSSTQIRKCIHWATSPSLWPELWSTRPRQFWYLYPSKDVIASEFKKKWEPEFMPRDDMMTHPNYGWRLKNRQGIPHEIEFNTGVSVYLKAYSQDVMHLQSGTVHAIFTDEELLESLYSELMFRLAASEGYFHMVFTATIGQDFWRRAVERIGCRDETLKGAFKQQVSMYDCMQYEDGTSGPWTEKKINVIKNSCKSEAEVLRRVHGRFVLDSGLKYPCYNRNNNMVEPHKIPSDWHIYTGVDIGSGGAKGHPSAICFVAVRPDYKKGVVFKGWKGGRDKVTTASDVLETYRVLRGGMKPVMQCYDHHAVDFKTYSSRLGETFVKAEKGQEIGEDIINVLFKNEMLDIFDIEELQDLSNELTSLTKETAKRFAKDDFIDSMRYAITRIPWDWSAITDALFSEKKKKEPELTEVQKRRKQFFEGDYEREEQLRVEEEIENYNELFAY